MSDYCSTKTSVEWAANATDAELIDDLKTSIMVALTDSDQRNAYENLSDVIADIDEIVERLAENEKERERAAKYERWWCEERKKLADVTKELEETKANLSKMTLTFNV